MTILDDDHEDYQPINIQVTNDDLMTPRKEDPE